MYDFKGWLIFQYQMSEYEQFIKVNTNKQHIILTRSDQSKYEEKNDNPGTRWILIVVNVFDSGVVRVVNKFNIEATLPTIQ